MIEEPNGDAPALENPEPAATEENLNPVPDESTEEAPEAEASETAPEEEESTEADSAPAEDDPFAEFDSAAPRDKAYYENLVKSDEWKHVPKIARNALLEVADRSDATQAKIDAVGGDTVLSALEPLTNVLADPNPTPEKVSLAFDTIDAHNAKVLEILGSNFTEAWVKEVVADPIKNLSPILQHTLQQYFGPEAGNIDLGNILELVQLAMAKDTDGEPILDIDTARQLFESNGGYNAFRHQQMLAERDRRIAELTNGYQPQNGQPQSQPTQPALDIDTDLESEALPKVEALMTRIGYKKDDPEFSMATDAVKYRLRHSPEADRIRGYAQNGSYKTSDGKFTPQVENNRTYLANRVIAQLVREMKGVQERRKAASVSAPATKIEKPATNGTKPVSAPAQKPSTVANVPKPPIDREAWIEQMAERFKAKNREAEQAQAIAAGR